MILKGCRYEFCACRYCHRLGLLLADGSCDCLAKYVSGSTGRGLDSNSKTCCLPRLLDCRCLFLCCLCPDSSEFSVGFNICKGGGIDRNFPGPKLSNFRIVKLEFHCEPSTPWIRLTRILEPQGLVFTKGNDNKTRRLKDSHENRYSQLKSA